MRIPAPSRRLRLHLARVSLLDVTKPAPSLRPAWWALVGWPTRTAVGHGPTLQQPAAETRSGGSGNKDSGRRSRRWRHSWVGGIGGATPYLPASRAEARADIVLARGITRPPVSLAQHQALSARQPVVTAHGPAPATRVRLVLLPHTRAEPTDTRTHNRRTERGQGMNHGDSSRQHSTPSDGTPCLIAANGQWHDAELAMTVARHSFHRWLVAGHKDTPSSAIMHAYHTHTALYEAARAITMLIDTFRAEMTALMTTSPDTPTYSHPAPVSPDSREHTANLR
jgi:hypothetical protein